MRLRTFILLASAIAMISCTVDRDVERPKVKAETDRKTAPDFTLKDATGQNVKLSDYRGKVVLLNFWATWCEPCQEEIPWFIDFEQQLKDRNFVVLGVSMDDDGWSAVKPFIAQKRINYRVMLGTEEVSGKFGGIDALPTTFILDRQGRIATSHLGLVPKKTYQDEILKLLDRATPTPDESVGASIAPAAAPPARFEAGSAAPVRSGAPHGDIVPLVSAYLRSK